MSILNLEPMKEESECAEEKRHGKKENLKTCVIDQLFRVSYTISGEKYFPTDVAFVALKVTGREWENIYELGFSVQFQ